MRGVRGAWKGVGIAIVALSCGACRSKENRAVKAFCEAFEDCQPENFAAEFDSVDDCREDTHDSLERAEEDNGPECADAFAVAIECAANVNAETCDFLSVVSECQDQIVHALELCPELDLDTLDLGSLDLGDL